MLVFTNINKEWLGKSWGEPYNKNPRLLMCPLSLQRNAWSLPQVTQQWKHLVITVPAQWLPSALTVSPAGRMNPDMARWEKSSAFCGLPPESSSLTGSKVSGKLSRSSSYENPGHSSSKL